VVDKIRVLLVDDHAIVREGLRALLSFHNDIDVVGEARDGDEAIILAGELAPDVVLMDIAMPRTDGLTATRAIRRRYPKTQVLILTQHEDRQYVLALLQAGAAGYVLKRALGTDLINGLRAVARGAAFLDPSVAAIVVDQMRGQGELGTPLAESLTPREREVVAMIARGQTSIQIAQALSLSVKTVEWHRSNVMSKLGVHSVADLVRYAMRNGLVDGQD
jgi:DNA-binding NarL/FixJ family response regulator